LIFCIGMGSNWLWMAETSVYWLLKSIYMRECSCIYPALDMSLLGVMIRDSELEFRWMGGYRHDIGWIFEVLELRGLLI
jgi:hypothetical protein